MRKIAIIVLICVTFFWGCNSTKYGEKSLDQIKEDCAVMLKDKELNTYGPMNQISDIKLIKRNTTEKSDDVYVSITFDSVKYQEKQDFHLIYNKYTTGGWIMDAYETTGNIEFIPTSGVDKRVVESVLNQYQLIYEQDYTVTAVNDDLINKNSSVVVEIHADYPVKEWDGTVTLRYGFDDVNCCWRFVDTDVDIDSLCTEKYEGTYICDYKHSMIGNQLRRRLNIKELYRKNNQWYENYWNIYLLDEKFSSASTEEPNTTWTESLVYYKESDKTFVTYWDICIATFTNNGLYVNTQKMDQMYEKISDDILTPEECAKEWVKKNIR